MTDDTPDVVVVLGDSGPIGVSSPQGPIPPKLPLIVTEHDSQEVELKPVVGEAGPLSHLSVLRPAEGRIEKHRVVKQLANGQVAYVNPAILDDTKYYLGITTDVALSGRPVTVAISGIIRSSSWSWVQGPVFGTHLGELTQVITGSTYRIGTALSSDSILLDAKDDGAAGGNAEVDTVVWPAPSATTVWTINHNLGRYPMVTVVDSAQNVIFADVTYVDINTVQINFAYATAGSAYLV